MPTWPAEQIPEMYPPGTAKKTQDEFEAVIKSLNELIRLHPKATPLQQRELVGAWCKKNRYSMEDGRDLPTVFIASAIAPELDNWVEVVWPKERTLDSDWGG